MTLDIRSEHGTVQVVMAVETLETILSRFPGLTITQIPTTEDDLPTYTFVPKELGAGSN